TFSVSESGGRTDRNHTSRRFEISARRSGGKFNVSSTGTAMMMPVQGRLPSRLAATSAAMTAADHSHSGARKYASAITTTITASTAKSTGMPFSSVLPAVSLPRAGAAILDLYQL